MTTPPDAAALSLAGRLPNLFFPVRPEAAPLPLASERVPEATDSFERGGAPADEVYEASLYRSTATQTRVNFSLTQAQGAYASEDGAEAASFAAQQLEFSFFQEVRSEELARFSQRTAESPAAGSSRYIETSQKIAARFEVNIKISGAALQNFSDTGDALADSEELLNKLLEFTNQLLSKADELFNEFFSVFAGGGTGESIQDLFARFQETFFSSEFVQGLQGLLGDGAAPGQGKTGAAAFQFEFSFAASFEVTATATVEESDPIVLDLDGDGIELTSYREGARFDILGNGAKQQTAFVTGGDAFLALDRNRDGIINDGTELFGDQRGAANGFEELRKLDTNGDGKISAGDKYFDKLLLFRDNGDGQTQKGELISLRDAGIESISLNYANVNEIATGGNRLTQIASFARYDGSTGRAADAMLNYTA